MKLPNTNKLLNHPLYQNYLKRLDQYEKDRIYCRHTLSHFLDVARITALMCREKNLLISDDVIYVTALLHDIGRVKEYEEKIPHDEASYKLAVSFLAQLDFTTAEKEQVLSAIKNHRQRDTQLFNQIFYTADKKSRLCFICSAQDTCKWSDINKNSIIEY